ncbi:unnamed protein product [Dicrocoelium dendriticum]|nr:unnamed protein product [Dicrocoelium dendriticum]
MFTCPLLSVSQLSPEASNCVTDPNRKFDEHYDIVSEIGRGRFAKVCEVRHKQTSSSFAAKIIRRWRNGKDTLDTFLQELRVLDLGKSSPHIIDFHDAYLQWADMVIVLEHAAGGDLYQLVHFESIHLPVDYVNLIIRQLLNAITFLHNRKIVHLDVKPENILLRRPFPDCDTMLCDFGLSKFLDDGNLIRGLVGTPDYAAPEILDYNPIRFTTDIWSVGVVTYFLLTGVSPFWGQTKKETFANVSQLRLSFPKELFADIPEAAISFIRRLLAKDPNDRPSASTCIQDAWLVGLPSSSPSYCEVYPGADTELKPVISENSRSDLDRSFGEH